VINTLAEAVEVIETLGSPQVRLMPDLYHMNIEEADLAASLRQCGAYIGHVHLADSNRMTPGLGHTDFRAALAALRDIGYQGALAIECKPPDDPHAAFPQALEFLRNSQ
jgi:sugar phosphate isomerase/epimerase